MRRALEWTPPLPRCSRARAPTTLTPRHLLEASSRFPLHCHRSTLLPPQPPPPDAPEPEATDDACAVCAEPLEWVAYGACGHREVCSVCVARLRFVLRDRRCCLCMTPCPAVFATKAMRDRTKVIGDFSALPAVAVEGKVGEYWYHEGTATWFDDADHYSMVRAMCRLSCSACDATSDRGKKGVKAAKAKRKNRFQSIAQLKAHLFSQHCLYMCDLCLEARKVFICEQKLYTRSQLDQHIKKGDLEVDGSEVECGGFVGHPMCKFCKSPFYGDNELYTHLTRDHYSCHICQRQDCEKYGYFRNYDALEMHFRSDHFLCEDEGCLEKKFIVFESEAEIKRHNSVEHQERMYHAQNNALQIPASFGDWSEQVHSDIRCRRHNVRPLGAINNTSLFVQNGLGIQVDSVAVPLRSLSIHSSSVQSSEAGRSSGTNSVFQQSHFSPLSCQEVPMARTGPILEEVVLPSISEQLRYAPALSQSSRSAARIEDEPFPALSTTSNRSAALMQQGLGKLAENNHTSGLRQHRKGTVKSHYSVQSLSLDNTDPIDSGSSASPSCPMPKPSSAISGSLILTSVGNENPEPLVTSHTLGVVEDVRAANKSLVERMRAVLGTDQDRFTTFKKISREYRQGVMGASEYLSHAKQFGLSHLVLEMARLLPDPQKQKELTDAYYASLRLASLQENGGGTASSLKEGIRKNKGKWKITDATETTRAADDSVEDKSLSAARKLQSNGIPQEGNSRVLLREGCGAGAAGHSDDGSSQVQQLGLPVRGVWQSCGGQRIISRNAR